MLAAFMWCTVCAVKPYWNKYWLAFDLKGAAKYATKNSIEDTRKRLTQLMYEADRNLTGEDFFIEKDKHNTATVGITYIDEIRIFGKTVKKLELTIEESSREASGFH